MDKNTQIINHLKKEICNIRVQVQEAINGYEKKEIYFRYTVKDSLLEKEQRENSFYYQDDQKKINELIKKGEMELFNFLVHKHLEKNQGYGKVPKAFQTPCYLCNQKTLTTLGWSEEGERFFCRLCRISFNWIDIKDDPVELQQEMAQYYQVFTEKDIEKSKQRMTQLNKEIIKVNEHLSNKRKLLAKLKGYGTP